MKIKHLLEGAEPKLPGAPSGVKVMSVQQFVAGSGGESEEEVAEGGEQNPFKNPLGKALYRDLSKEKKASPAQVQRNKERWAQRQADKSQGVTEDAGQEPSVDDILYHLTGAYRSLQKHSDAYQDFSTITHLYETLRSYLKEGDIEGFHSSYERMLSRFPDAATELFDAMFESAGLPPEQGTIEQFLDKCSEQDVAEEVDMGQAEKRTPAPSKNKEEEDKVFQAFRDRVRKLRGEDLEEATKLPAQQRELGGQEFQDYMKRIVGTPDVDKAGNVKVDKKGAEKYVSGKTKADKFKLPYIHRSSVVEYLGPDGKTYDEDKIKQTLAVRPKALLKQNEKMKHSNGEFEQFFNVGFAALTGIALDENTNNLIVVNTCPGAGACKVDCFAMKGGKIQFKAAWQSDGRILTYLLNDPDGFFSQLSAEIAKEERLGQKGSKGFEGGWKVTVRWHDAGDFFSPEYLDMAFKMAKAHPNVKFYAYTKMAAAALADKPANFIINWSEGAHTSQEKQVKAQDPNLERTKNSRIVPTDLFGDLLAKDAKGNLAKGPEGQWVIVPNKLPELKQRMAQKYGISANSILGYDEWDQKTNGGKKETPVKYNVIIAPGEPDITANTPGVLSTLLLRH